jgi:CRP-like cAMP-binding protein
MHLVQYLQHHWPFLTETDLRAFTKITRLVSLKRGQVFLHQGEVCHTSAFVESGLLRHYSVDADGNQRVLQFSLPNSFASNCESFLLQAPSAYCIEAVQATRLNVFRNADLNQLCTRHPVFDKVGRDVSNGILGEHKKHLMLLATFPAQLRWTELERAYPEYLKSLSVKQLAQFVGLSRETVSRLRAKRLLQVA